MKADGVLRASLAGIATSLLLIGFVSGTPFRHLVQLVPVAIALVLVIKRWSSSPYAALPLFVFWLLIMVGIWLHLLGIADVITGQFRVSEIVLTVAIGVSCAAGIVAVLRHESGSTGLARLLAVLVLGSLQVGAMWLSLQPGLGER